MKKMAWTECIFPHNVENRCVDTLGKYRQERHVKDEVRSVPFLVNSGEKAKIIECVLCNLPVWFFVHLKPYIESKEKKMDFLLHYHALTVLKYSIPDDRKASATSLVVTTHDMGWPLPIGFPMVTMSGTKSSPWSWKAQKWVPTRPKPTWTSSAMKTPPALRTCL